MINRKKINALICHDPTSKADEENKFFFSVFTEADVLLSDFSDNGAPLCGLIVLNFFFFFEDDNACVFIKVIQQDNFKKTNFTFFLY